MSPERIAYIPVPDPLGIAERLTQGAPVQLKDPLRQAVASWLSGNPSNTQGVKAEFGAPCWGAYNTALENLRFLARAHDIHQVMAALRQDLGMTGGQIGI